MTRKTPSTPAEYWQFLLRRKWWVIIPAVFISMSVCVITWRLPRLYKSETMIMVDPQKVPEQYVQSTVNADVANRLQTISQEILSRTRMQKVVEQFGLYKELRKNKTQEEVLDQMRMDINVDVVTDPRESRPGVGGFKIAYSGRDPQLVQQVTRQLASLFIEENLKVREQQAEGTSEFISAELEKARQTLQSQEEKLEAFKSRYTGALPEQQQSNLQMLGQLQGLLQTNSDAIGRAQNQKQYLTSMLDTVGKLQPQMQTKTPVQLELEARTSELLSAEQKYKADHPDVVRLRAEVKALETQAAEEKRANPAAYKPGEAPDQIKLQIAGIDQEIKSRTAQMTATEQKIRSIQGRVDSLPAVEQQFTALNRDYEVSKVTYQQLLAKSNGASMSAEMERRAKGEQFRIVDPANLPEKPFKPNVPQLNAFGVVGGLLVGIGLAFVVELKDHSIHNKHEMAYYLSVPVLATMPMILTQEDRVLAKKLLIKRLVIGSAAGVVAAVLGIVVLRSAFFNSLLGRS